MRENEYTAWCNLCKPPTRHPVEDIMGHLRVEHDFTDDVATWPDGECVVYDGTLEPEDFAK